MTCFLLDGRVWRSTPPKHGLAYALSVFTLSAVLVSFTEEVLFRGYMKDVLGGVFSAFLYAIVHFFRPMKKTQPADGYERFLVFERFGDLMEGWMNVQNMTWGISTLFLFGLALNKLRDRTGTLYVGIGLHAGWVFCMRFYQQWIDPVPNGSRMIWGGNRVHDGLVGMIAMLILLLLAYKAPLPAKLRKPDETPLAPAA